jgi:hypothetical protein
MGEGGGGECGGPDGGRAGTQERPAVEHEHVCSPLRVVLYDGQCAPIRPSGEMPLSQPARAAVIQSLRRENLIAI